MYRNTKKEIMNEPVRQHYIPQSYLKYFATEVKGDFLIDAYDIRTGKALKNKNISTICFKKHLYTLDNMPADKKYFVEKFYADHVDSNFTEIHKILTDPKVEFITIEQKEKIILSLLSLYFRTTKFLHGSFSVLDKIIDGLVESSTDKEIRFTYEGERHVFNKNEANEFKNKLKEEQRMSFVLSHLEYWEDFYTRKLKNGLMVCKMEDVQLITSDNPVIIGSYDRRRRFHIYDPTNIIQIPIDKEHYLFLTPDEDEVDPLFVARGIRDKWFALECNKEMENKSERWIISELGGIEKHLEQQIVFGSENAEAIAMVERQSNQLVYYKKLKDLSDKYKGNMLAPEVIKLWDEYSQLDLFKDDLSFMEVYRKLKT
jgi:hypothetical protein